MIYIDDMNHKASVGRHSSKRWFHMISDPPDDDELKNFAARIGLNPKHIQSKRRGKFIESHFDVTAGMKKKALAAGAQQITARDLVLKMLAVRRLRGQPS